MVPKSKSQNLNTSQFEGAEHESNIGILNLTFDFISKI